MWTHQKRWNYTSFTYISYAYELLKSGQIDIYQVHSNNNFVDYLISNMSTIIFENMYMG